MKKTIVIDTEQVVDFGWKSVLGFVILLMLVGIVTSATHSKDNIELNKQILLKLDKLDKLEKPVTIVCPHKPVTIECPHTEVDLTPLMEAIENKKGWFW